MNLSLEGRNAVICGSSQGIGYAIAEELAVMGANCILLARNEDNLRIATSQLDTAIRQTHSYHCIDFNDIDETRQLIQRISEEQNIHILINNSGGPPAGPIMDATEDEFIAAFNQHLIAYHILTRAVINGMKEDGYGRVINIISTSVKIPLKNLGVSNTIRGAVASWAKTLANELGEFNITVNNVLPGFTKTERLDAIVEDTSHKKNLPSEEVEKAMIQEVPMKRFGDANEVAAVAVFLASPAASYVNGASITVDGGRTGSI